jgi:excisionase family DNA binding protein
MTQPQTVLKPDRVTYSVAEAAAALGVSRATIYTRIAEGDLQSFRWGGRRLIRAEDLQAALDAASGRPAKR